ncbi:hypothetical protein pCPXV0146 [Cowpox virus]|uniref:Uncharacterized protein n=1 Tax=Cowpox virus TaxID=10243 RepID=A0A0K2YX39_COWPX|nr:hypothetical protein pCPXV0146 [Cowpox virus]CUI02365.1 hypothetical protein pCPXV0146 [Cowpox virus]SNB48900.1 hypothetical protein pCPXV0146 [Cowpox virus]SNB50341.1 hypothetical protein pCPXV0146 [Cowpox virus]SNB50520.1 hypothetical protein pCPXV0146 [Cowpox virus]
MIVAWFLLLILLEKHGLPMTQGSVNFLILSDLIFFDPLHAKSGSSLQNTDLFKCMLAINGLGPLSNTSVKIV